MSKDVILKRVFENPSTKDMIEKLSNEDKVSIENEVKTFADRIESFAEKLFSISNDPELSAKYKEALIRIRENSRTKG